MAKYNLSFPKLLLWILIWWVKWEILSRKVLSLEIPCDLESGSHRMCTVPGKDYPWHAIDEFLEDQRGTAFRMFGATPDPYKSNMDMVARDSANYRMRSITQAKALNPCIADVSVEQPYWSKNHKGQLRVIVNHTPFEQFVQMEKCLSTPDDMDNSSTDAEPVDPTDMQCPGDDCMCMQEYRQIRLVAYDPQQDEKGIFMDWFEFPCCCQCKCVIREEGSSNSTISPVTTTVKGGQGRELDAAGVEGMQDDDDIAVIDTGASSAGGIGDSASVLIKNLTATTFPTRVPPHNVTLVF